MKQFGIFSLACALAFSSLAPAYAYSVAPSVPSIIQGGMGIRISQWKLAREVALKGELGVVSGTAMDNVMVRELQKGDAEGSFFRALKTFPDQDMANRIVARFYIEGGKDPSEPYKSIPMWTLTPNQLLLEANVLANYCEVWLAKHNDDGSIIDGLVGMNLLTKVQLPTIASLYGAMMAGVDYIIMGAGIPISVPGFLDNLSECKDCEQKIDVDGVAEKEAPVYKFSPIAFWEAAGKPELAAPLKRPSFLPIVSSTILAQSLLKKASGKGPTRGIQGFVVELSSAGGHNAPPRGFKFDPVFSTHAGGLNERGEPVYGPKDEVDLAKFCKACQGLPFWLAGSYARPERFAEVRALGGAGVQCGTIFALAEESGLDDWIKQDILRKLSETRLDVLTDPAASPTGFPFKVLDLPQSLSQRDVYEARPRACNLGYLRQPYKRPDGKIGYRCPAEPEVAFARKGGDAKATVGRKCLCNALCSNAGFPQVGEVKAVNGEKMKYVELPLITTGDDISSCRDFIKEDADGHLGFPAGEIVDYLLSEWKRKPVGSAAEGSMSI
jgi:NAD(P)H-dependent flavin oxidoreductase YrpB (nitropropane dioxygenase family)|uniref:2-nitropropane dioxygenase n=1 Tax=Phaeodactylum tricornutum TaxID=2850 RepID=A0A8J9TAL6_PHATR